MNCIHGKDVDEFCPECEDEDEEGREDCSNPPTDDERGIIETLLAHAPLTGKEVDDLEEMLDEDDLDSERYQEIYNSHVSILHLHNQ